MYAPGPLVDLQYLSATEGGVTPIITVSDDQS